MIPFTGTTTRCSRRGPGSTPWSRTSGNIFAIPTYLFLGSALVMIAVGVFRIVVLGEHGEGEAYAPTLADQVGGTIQRRHHRG